MHLGNSLLRCDPDSPLSKTNEGLEQAPGDRLGVKLGSTPSASGAALTGGK